MQSHARTCRGRGGGTRWPNAHTGASHDPQGVPGLCPPCPLPGHAGPAGWVCAQEETFGTAGCKGEVGKGTRSPGQGPKGS